MAENVSTGGLKVFRHGKDDYSLDSERKKEIEEGYGKYYERRERERKQKIIWWTAGILVGLVIICLVGLKLLS